MSKQSSNANPHSSIHSSLNEEAGYQQYCREQRRCYDASVRLLKRIGESRADRENIRKAIIEHCRTYRISERTFWYYLVCYSEQRSFSLDDQPDALFGASDEYLRQQIPSLIPRIPHRRLAHFKKLLCFTSSFLDRMNYLFDWLLSSFLEKTIKQDSALFDDDEILLDEELFFLCERIIINAIAVMQRSAGNESDEQEF